ncbi:MAG: hypothetical protein AAB453_01615 [Patescibacteria group bacterium]
MIKTLLIQQIYFIFLLAGFLAFIIATIILSFHWASYGAEVPAIKRARPVFYLGSFLALGLMLWSYFLIT